MFIGVGIPETQSMPQIEARESLGLSLDGPLFLHFGENHSMKCYEVIFQAFRSLPSYYKLIFAGRVQLNIQDNNPRKLASKYDCNKKTIIIDQYIPEEKMRQYFYAADAVIISHRREHRGGSGVLAPACQYGVPVIASNTDTGELGEIVNSYKLGLTFTAEDHQSLQESILSFLNLEEDKRKEIKNNLFNFALTHSWEKAAEDHVALYQNLIRA
jgi:glycosyltransferase involved in cell wall biosynthesis